MTSATRGRVSFTPFLDLLLVWNKGISYGLFNNNAQGILVGLSLLVCAMLWIWLCRSHRPVTAAALGLVIGGALGQCPGPPDPGGGCRFLPAPLGKLDLVRL